MSGDDAKRLENYPHPNVRDVAARIAEIEALLAQCLKMMGRVRWMLVDAEAQALPAYDTLAKEVEKVVAERSES